MQAFQTDIGSLGILYNTLSLHGFWGEALGRVIPNYALHSAWIVIFLIIIAMVGYGIVTVYQRIRHQSYTIVGILILITAYILAMGIKAPLLGPTLIQWMYDTIPMYIGLREPQKWLIILVIAYPILGAIGLHQLYQKLASSDTIWRWVSWMVALLPIVYTPMILFGFRGQLHITHYPQSYYTFKNWLYDDAQYKRLTGCQDYPLSTSEKGCFEILVLPWHQYMALSFNARIAPNPWDDFFQSHASRTYSLLIGDNMEMAEIYTQSQRPQSYLIEKYVRP